MNGRKWIRVAARLWDIEPGVLPGLIRAQWELVRARIHLWVRPKGGLLDFEAPLPAAVPDPAQIGRAKRMALAIERAADFGLFRPSCLVRAVALHRWMNARGLEGSRIRLGVAPRVRPFTAHAWVEYAGIVLDDSEGRVGRYIVLPDLDRRPPRSHQAVG